MDMEVTMKYENKYRLGTAPLSTEDCISPAYFAKEKELLFKRSWLFVGRDEELPGVGSYLVKDIAVLDTSVIVIRNKDNKIKAFHNICTHRLNKIMQPGAGKIKTITCRFHGWAFDLDGTLIHSSNEDLFPDFRKEKLSLVPVHADVWNGFIFINVASKPKVGLRESLGEFADQFDGYFDNNMVLRQKWQTDINANWKLVLDSQTEAYHAPTLHAKTLRNAVSGKDNPNCYFNDVRLMGKHRSMEVYGNPEYKPTKVEGMAGGYAKTPLYPATSATTDALPPGVNSTRNPLWVFDINILFPNFLLAPANGWYGVMLFWPLTADKTRFEFRQYLYKPETAGDIIAQEYGLAHGRDVIREDLSTMEGTQQMMQSGVLKEIQLCDEEITVRHNHLSVYLAITE
jgi:phenylpropionate dioxygenase-like ring-hydroxylating dioxygenase large terminal subunit